MVDIAKIGQIAQDCSPQELHAALMWQQNIKTFGGQQLLNGQEIVIDLNQHSHLWSSFLLTTSTQVIDPNGWVLQGLVETLMTMSIYRAAQAGRQNYYHPYPANQLYVLASNQDTIGAQLMEFGKKWCADEVELYDGTIDCAEGMPKRFLNRAAFSEDAQELQDAVVLSYWWDDELFLRQIDYNANSEASSVLEASGKPMQLTLSLVTASS